MARALGIYGSIDANRGDPQNGWDTDQFPNSVEELTLAMIEIIRAGGFTDGGFNFDAKVRRQSIDAIDLFHGHIGGIDVIAHALVKAEAIINNDQLDAFRSQRYAGWQGAIGKSIHAPTASLASIADLAIQHDFSPEPKSGRQEWLERHWLLLTIRANVPIGSFAPSFGRCTRCLPHPVADIAAVRRLPLICRTLLTVGL